MSDNERQEFQGITLEKFRKMALNPNTDQDLLEALSLRHRISRKQALLDEIRLKTVDLYRKDGEIEDLATVMSRKFI
ncbi:hypothetical protein [Suicoccus acidiformans]|uniref:hypothetical protein n=1 Tax=Suicoccus acidiformans TaxID=2036206 RepID=UPI0013C373B8|nr:hypothetical protein [Suicoccus acidiformans]